MAYQTVPGKSAALEKIDGHFTHIRQMEAEGGAFGLNAVFNVDETNHTIRETSGSNGVDTHMIKNTEWGAVGMLASSRYGSGAGNITNTVNNKIYDVSASTTNNPYGVYGMNKGLAEHEYTAGIVAGNINQDYNRYIENAEKKHIDNYKRGVSGSSLEGAKDLYKPGDGMYETRGVPGGGGQWIHGVSMRGGTGALYSYSTNWQGHYWGVADFGSRVVVWVGSGL